MDKKVDKNVDNLAIKEEMITLKPSVTCQNGHKFIYRSAIEVVCTECPLGYMLTADMQVKEGHIYSGEKLLI